ncbi:MULTISPECIES: ABC transporter ATP-binding protein [Cupriavidus]|uniref:ABC transporter ATP-binding protein n=1 Tax=Cupriavidus pauculus TaxID=82633 RepID=A0A5P2H9B3_9BURK|nr:ABC transporter ATP-binding protein [Cupriavidus pauculus]QET04787.1 ABC transporter ATP-binding protein [Cupriavidus pauculus]
MSATAILQTRGVTKRFGNFVANDDITVSLEPGRLTAIIGPNGAGKSTFFNMISGGLAPTSGEIVFNGKSLIGLRSHEFAKVGISKSFQITNLFPALSVLENVRVAVQCQDRTYDLWTPRSRHTEWVAKAEALLELVGLQDKRHAAADSLAHGEQRSLEIAVALASDPRLLLLDEPTAGMSPEETRAIMDLILKLLESRTIGLVEHKMKLVMGVSDSIIVLHQGSLLVQGRPDDIRANEDVRRVYLGKGNH